MAPCGVARVGGKCRSAPPSRSPHHPSGRGGPVCRRRRRRDLSVQRGIGPAGRHRRTPGSSRPTPADTWLRPSRPTIRRAKPRPSTAALRRASRDGSGNCGPERPRRAGRSRLPRNRPACERSGSTPRKPGHGATPCGATRRRGLRVTGRCPPAMSRLREEQKPQQNSSARPAMKAASRAELPRLGRQHAGTSCRWLSASGSRHECRRRSRLRLAPAGSSLQSGRQAEASVRPRPGSRPLPVRASQGLRWRPPVPSRRNRSRA